MSEVSSSDITTRSMLKQAGATVQHLTGTLESLLAEKEAMVAQLQQLKVQIREKQIRNEALGGLISSTQTSKEQMERVVGGLRRLLSPIKTLPTEVLVRIFTVIIEMVHKNRQNTASLWNTPAVDMTSLLLAQVCMRWRQIFQCNPLLWGYLEFRSWCRGPTIERSGQLERFRHYARLGVSSQQTLFLPDLDQEIYSLLKQESSKLSTPLRALRMDIGSHNLATWDVKAIAAEDITIYRDSVVNITFLIPLLRLASTITAYGDLQQWDGPPWAKLHTLRLKNFCPGINRPKISLTSEGITQLLNATPFLTRLELDFEIDKGTAVGQGSSSASHVNLKHLAIHLHHYEAGKGLFGIRLDLPALQTLEFLSIQYKAASFEEESSVLSALSPKTLILPYLDEHEVTVAAQLLRHLQSIECLEMIGRNSGTLLTFIHSSYHTLPLVSPPLTRKLSNLRIEGTDVVGNTLLRFIEVKLKSKQARMESVSALETVEMYDTPGVPPADWWEIQALLKEGCALNRADPIQ